MFLPFILHYKLWKYHLLPSSWVFFMPEPSPGNGLFHKERRALSPLLALPLSLAILGSFSCNAHWIFQPPFFWWIMSCQEETSSVWDSKSRAKISSKVWLPLQSLNSVCISQRCCFPITTAGSTCDVSSFAFTVFDFYSVLFAVVGAWNQGISQSWPKSTFSISVNVKTPKYAFLVLREYNSSRCIQRVGGHSCLQQSSTFEM